MIVAEEGQKEVLLEAGRRLRKVLDAVLASVLVGVDAKSLDDLAHRMILDGGDTPTFLGYCPSGMGDGYPAVLCVSVNDEVVHGVPKKETVFRDGDVVSVDCGLQHEGVFVDAACTVIVGEGDERARALLEANRKALRYALVFARAGARTGDIGSAVESVADEYDFVTPPELGGHGVGGAQHEDPFIPNIGDPDSGECLQAGQVLAIEPIFFEGKNPHVAVSGDGFTYKTVSGERSSHFEHTVLLTNGAPVLVTGEMW